MNVPAVPPALPIYGRQEVCELGNDLGRWSDPELYELLKDEWKRQDAS